MNVLSLFDGMSCGQIALERTGIKVDNYFASEIDKHAIKVTQHNYPATIQLGDVAKVLASGLPQIDLLIGGSPCQGFSFAGKQLNFDDPRSRLFFEYVRLLEAVKPKYFLLENVPMRKEHQDIISSALGAPILINSNLVSAQNRKRLYWTNIGFEQVPDKNIFLKDILLKSGGKIIDISGVKTWKTKNYLQYDLRGKGYKSQDQRAYYLDGKHGTLTACNGKSKAKVLMPDGKVRCLLPVECERLQNLRDNYTSSIPEAKRYNCIGNGWTVDVIAHIFKGLKNEALS